jgi:hypothetical protein
MQGKRLWLALLLMSFYVSAQTKGVVVDESGKPIPYVNIWVENENIGTTSEENGEFSIADTENKTLVFSAIGFETLKAKLNESGKIVLKSIAYQLDEVLIQKRIGKDQIEIGKYKKRNINLYYGTVTSQPTIMAKFIAATEDIKTQPFIDNITFLTLSQINKAKIKIRFYEVAPDGSPGLDYSDDIIIFTVKNGKQNNTLDLKDKNLIIPDKGLFIAFEWMIIEENKYTYKYTLDEENNKVQGALPDSKKKVYKDGIQYEPSIGTIPSDSSTTWQYIAGKWVSRKIHKKSNLRGGLDKYDNKFGELAIKITLTN